VRRFQRWPSEARQDGQPISEFVRKRQAKKSKEAMFWNRDIASLCLGRVDLVVRPPERLATSFQLHEKTARRRCPLGFSGKDANARNIEAPQTRSQYHTRLEAPNPANNSDSHDGFSRNFAQCVVKAGYGATWGPRHL